jgi:pilus assembly protein CpaF
MISDELWDRVEALRGHVSSHDALQPLLSRLALVHDPDENAAQHAEFREAVANSLAGSPTARLIGSDPKPAIDLLYDELCGISVLGPFWRDPRVTEIIVDGWDSINIERDDHLQTTDVTFRDLAHGTRVLRELAASVSDRALNANQPIVYAELPRARGTFIVGATVRSGLSATIRKFKDLLPMSALIRNGSVETEIAQFLYACMRSRANVLVGGGTGTGKTTIINALSEAIPHDERVITIEDSFELKLENTHQTQLQSSQRASGDDTTVITLADLLVVVLRMRPNRIIVGEIREHKAAAVLLQAANTGHDGVMTTLHANDVVGDLAKMRNFAVAGADLPADVAAIAVAEAFDLVIHISRHHISGKRYVRQVAEVDRTDAVNGVITSNILWNNDIVRGDDGTWHVEARQVGHVRADSDLGRKLTDEGFGEMCR